jgi:drug/metabolite transporter (DMT)-like permease
MGEAASFLASLCWAISVCVFRRHGKGWPAHRLNLFKNTVAVVGLGGSLVLFPAPFPSEFWMWRDLIFSGLIGIVVGDTAAFVVLEAWGAQVASSSFCLSPPFTALISWLILGESLSLREWTGLVITVGSIVGVVTWGSRSQKSKEGRVSYSLFVVLLCCLLCPLSQAIGSVWAKRALTHVDPLMAAFIRMLFAAIALALLGKRIKKVFWGNLKDPSVKAIFWSSFLGAFVGVYLMTLGLSLTKAGIAGTLSAMYPLWVIPISHGYLKEKVTKMEIGFTVTAIAGVVLMLTG